MVQQRSREKGSGHPCTDILRAWMLTCRYNQIRRKIKRFSPSAGTLLCLYALFASELPSEAFFEEKQEINRVERKRPHKASPFTTINADKPSRKGRPECGLPLSSYVTALAHRSCQKRGKCCFDWYWRDRWWGMTPWVCHYRLALQSRNNFCFIIDYKKKFIKIWNKSWFFGTIII